MKRLLKILIIVAIGVVLLIAAFVVSLVYNQSIQTTDQKIMIKSDDELLGMHLYIERDNKDDIDVNWYQAEVESKQPLVINIHGGAFIAGDADTLDTQSDRFSKDWGVNVATINYKLLNENISKQYVIEEISDTVKYFIEHSEEYNVDVNRIYIMGYSAGGYYAMASTLDLIKDGVNIKGQILCYAFIGDIMEQFATLTDEQKQNIPSALFILAGDEPISKGSLAYEALIRENSVHTNVKVYDEAKHGFIEENNPEYEVLHKKNKTSKSPEAEVIARQAEQYINDWMLGAK